METMENNLIEKHGTRKRMKVDSAIVCREKLVCLPRQSCHEDCEKIKLCEEVTVVE